MPRNFLIEEEYRKNPYAKIAHMILNAREVVYFTGAGIGTDSGIPDYRGMGSTHWAKYNLSDFSFERFLFDEECRREYWRMDEDFYNLAQTVNPNATHYALAELEKKGKVRAVITQNVDGLHQRAGNSPAKVIEIHGSIFTVSCLQCFKKYSHEEVSVMIKKGMLPPYCSFCRGILKSDTITFGQPLPQDVSAKALIASLKSDLFVVLGSSLLVQPAAYLIVKAKEAGAKIVIINLSATPYDTYADVVIYENARQTMVKIMEKIK